MGRIRAYRQTVSVWALMIALVVTIHFLAGAGYISGYYMQIVQMMGINVMLTTSLNLVNGYLGEFAIGHAGFMGVGAYMAAICTVKWALPFPIALAAAAAAAGLFAGLVAIPAFSTSGDYLAVITLGFNMIIVSVIHNISYVGGPRGLPGLPKATNLLWVAALLLLSLIVMRNLVDSNYGRMWMAIRDNRLAAELMGANVRAYQVLAMIVAGAIAGVAGALFGHLLQYVHPRSFDLIKSTEMLAMLYVGGVGSLGGAALGAVLITGLVEALRGFGVWWLVVSPLILIIIMLRLPRGLMGGRGAASR